MTQDGDNAGDDKRPEAAAASDASGASTGAASAEGAAPAAAEGGERDGAGVRKERVLHTRVPAVLERELKRFAENLRIPVSNLIRTILEDAVNVADAAGDRVEEQLKSAARQLELERHRLRQRVRIDPLADVFAYQAVTVAQRASCAKCGDDLVPGARAHLGLTDGVPGAARPRVFVCESCLPRG